MTRFATTRFATTRFATAGLFAAALFAAGAAQAEPALIHKGGTDAPSLPVESQNDAAPTSALSFRDAFDVPTSGAQGAMSRLRHISRDGAGNTAAGNTAEDHYDDN